MNGKLFTLPMPIITPRLLLRPPQIGDGAVVNAAVLESFAELHAWMPWAKEKQSLEETEEFIRQAVANWILKRSQEPWFPLFIFDINTNDFIGATGFHHTVWEVPCLEIGYWITKSYSGRGLMTEAVNALTRYAIQHLEMKRVEIRCDKDNIKSKNIPEQLGYKQEAILAANRIKPNTGEISDSLIYVRHTIEELPKIIVKWQDKI